MQRSVFLALTDWPRAVADFGSLPWAAGWLATAPRGDGHPVLVLPGFLASDRSTAVLRRYLAWQGNDVHAWQLGRNLGQRSIGADGELLIERLKQIHQHTGQKLSLVGWSLGGAMARFVARRQPELVRQVITLGSPISHDQRSKMRGNSEALPVPATAIFSKADGIVPWQNAVEPRAAQTDNIQVHGSHIGLGVNPAVLYAIADRLALQDGAWRPFVRSGVSAVVYP